MVFQNAFLPALTGRRERSGVIATIGSTRNFGIAIGPGLEAVMLLLVLELRAAMALLGCVTAACVFLVARWHAWTRR